MKPMTLDDAERPDDYVLLMGSHAQDVTTGIAGRITAICFNEREETQLALTRHGVDTNGHAYAKHWAHALDCAPCSADKATSL